MLNYSSLKIIIAAATLISLCSSCKKFLEEDPKNLVVVTNYYQTENDAIAAVDAIYGYLNSTSTGSTAGVYHSTFWVIAGCASDEMVNKNVFQPDVDQISNFVETPVNNSLEETWTMHYKAITLANTAIARIPAIQMDNTLKERLLNEAHFLRGLLYFDIVRMFGSIPLVLQEEEPLTPSSATVNDIYQQIIADLTAAENLPDSYTPGDGRGRATKGAAKSILAKVYLTQQNWQACADKCNEVITSNQYALWDDFADVFKLSSRGGKEAIFSVGFGDGGGAISFWEVGQFNVRLLPPALNATGVQNAQGWQVPTQNLYDDYDPQDRRREVTYITQIYNADGSITTITPYIRKYWDSLAEPQANGSANDYPVIRYADVLLMYAEAENELGNMSEALTYLNMIRKRARWDGTKERTAVADYTGLSQDQFRAAVLKERRMEFVAEGQRWFDLARTKTLQTLVPIAKPGIVPQEKNYLFPIPQREIDLNPNLKQNTGY